MVLARPSGRRLAQGAKPLHFAAALAMLALAACSDRQGESPSDAPEASEAPDTFGQAEPVTRALPGSLEWAAEGEWRLSDEKARDVALHRIEVARLLNLDTVESILELDPGAGGWTAVLAPAAASRGASYRVAMAPAALSPEAAALIDAFNDRFADPAVFGDVAVVELGPATPALAPEGSIDAAVAVDAVPAWMALGYAEKAFADVYAALEPGGRFGVIAPRARSGGAQDPGAASGYVQQGHVVRLAQDAGFTLETSSELLANPADDADHPFGVWTVAPYRLTAPLGEPADPAFNRAELDAIGEPDRMTLVFRKPR